MSDEIFSYHDNYYSYHGEFYDIHFPEEWALTHIPGTGPAECVDCKECGNWRGVFIGYCENCAKFEYEFQRGTGFLGNGVEKNESDSNSAFNTYLSGTDLDEIGKSDSDYRSDKESSVISDQEEEEKQLRNGYANELNTAFIQEDDTSLDFINNNDYAVGNVGNVGNVGDVDYYYDNDDIVTNDILTRSQLIAKIHQLERKIAKQDRKIKKQKKHVKEYRGLLDNQVGLFEIVCNYAENLDKTSISISNSNNAESKQKLEKLEKLE